MWEETTRNDNNIYRAEHRNADIDLSQGQQGGRKNPIVNQGYPTSKETIHEGKAEVSPLLLVPKIYFVLIWLQGLEHEIGQFVYYR